MLLVLILQAPGIVDVAVTLLKPTGSELVTAIDFSEVTGAAEAALLTDKA